MSLPASSDVCVRSDLKALGLKLKDPIQTVGLGGYDVVCIDELLWWNGEGSNRKLRVSCTRASRGSWQWMAGSGKAVTPISDASKCVEREC